MPAPQLVARGLAARHRHGRGPHLAWMRCGSRPRLPLPGCGPSPAPCRPWRAAGPSACGACSPPSRSPRPLCRTPAVVHHRSWHGSRLRWSFPCQPLQNRQQNPIQGGSGLLVEAPEGRQGRGTEEAGLARPTLKRSRRSHLGDGTATPARADFLFPQTAVCDADPDPHAGTRALPGHRRACGPGIT